MNEKKVDEDTKKIQKKKIDEDKTNKNQQDGWTLQISLKNGELDLFYSPHFDRYQVIGVLEVEAERLKEELLKEMKAKHG